MGKFGGFGGGFGGGNMQALMKQAQKMQEEANRAKEELEETEVVGEASGGVVKVVVTGAGEPVSVTIDPKIVDPDDVEMIEDMVLVAFKDAMSKATELKNSKLGKFGGMM